MQQSHLWWGQVGGRHAGWSWGVDCSGQSHRALTAGLWRLVAVSPTEPSPQACGGWIPRGWWSESQGASSGESSQWGGAKTGPQFVWFWDIVILFSTLCPNTTLALTVPSRWLYWPPPHSPLCGEMPRQQEWPETIRNQMPSFQRTTVYLRFSDCAELISSLTTLWKLPDSSRENSDPQTSFSPC